MKSWFPASLAFAASALLAIGCAVEAPSVTGCQDAVGCPCNSDQECGGATPRCDRNRGRCMACLPFDDNNCPAGQRCVPSSQTFVCAAGCLAAADCPRSDAGNVSECCGGACRDALQDVGNCGACGRACPIPKHGMAGCVSGACVIGSCAAGFADCDRIVGNGCEVEPANDPANCGSCGNICPNDAPVCSSGQCIGTFFVGSAIITRQHSQTLNAWLESPNVQWKRCYQKSKDGASSYTFHKKCDGLGPSIAVAKHSNGAIIGGYASQSWNNFNSYYGDMSSFLFSLTNNFVHKPNNEWYLYGAVANGPAFGGGFDWATDPSMATYFCGMGYTYSCRVGGYASAQCTNDFCGSGLGTFTTDELEVWVK